MKHLKTYESLAPMNLQNLPLIYIDDDEIEFVQDYLEPGKIELYGNELYYDENDALTMNTMMDLFPNEFEDYLGVTVDEEGFH